MPVNIEAESASRERGQKKAKTASQTPAIVFEPGYRYFVLPNAPRPARRLVEHEAGDDGR